MVMWWLARVVEKALLFFWWAPVAGPKTVRREAQKPSSLRSMVMMGVHLEGNWLSTPLPQSLIWIATVREIFDVGIGAEVGREGTNGVSRGLHP